jgi:hypothetical protein
LNDCEGGFTAAGGDETGAPSAGHS